MDDLHDYFPPDEPEHHYDIAGIVIVAAIALVYVGLLIGGM